ncbi:MAG: oxygenase MpaB family protein [Gemmatimonadota bacterium]|nr:oxygenase MpaB family protein [Gemmatimonadota bacterium]
MSDFDLARVTDGFLDVKRTRGDPEADVLIERLAEREGPERARALFDRLIREIELDVAALPEELRRFVEGIGLPEWADPTLIARSEAVFREHGPRYLLLLYFKSLPTLYACAKGATVLTSTGRLAHDGADMRIFARRIAETGQFLVHVMEPGGLERGAGRATALKIRFIHASIRAFVRARGWDEPVLGAPINQEDLAITLQTFSSTILRGLAQTGIELGADERRAVMHHWCVVGHLLGIDGDLLPEEFEEGVALEDRILRRQAAASEEGRLLTGALVGFARERLPRRFRNAPQLLVAYLVDERVERAVGIEDRLPWYVRLLPRFLTRLFRIASRLTDYHPTVDRTVDTLASLLTLAMVNYFNNYKEAPFYVPQALKRAWIGDPE